MKVTNFQHNICFNIPHPSPQLMWSNIFVLQYLVWTFLKSWIFFFCLSSMYMIYLWIVQMNTEVYSLGKLLWSTNFSLHIELWPQIDAHAAVSWISSSVSLSFIHVLFFSNCTYNKWSKTGISSIILHTLNIVAK